MTLYKITNTIKNNTLIKNIFSLSLGRIINIFVSLITSVFLIKTLEIEVYGTFKYALSLVSTFLFVQEMGIGLFITRRMSRSKRNASDMIVNAISVRAILNILFLVLMFIISLSTEKAHMRPFLIIFSISLFFEMISNTVSSYYFASKDMGYSVRFDAAQKIGLLISLVIFVSIWKSLLWIAISFLISRVFVSIYSLLIINREIGGFKFKIRYSEMIFILKGGLPFVLSGLAFSLYSQIDNLMLYWMRNEKDVAIYNVGTFVFAGISFVPTIVCKALFPLFSRSIYKINENESTKYLNLSIEWILMVSLPILAICYPLAKPILFILSSSKYVSSVPVFQIYLIVLSFSWLSILFGYFLNASNKEYQVVKNGVIATVIKIIINFIFINFFGIVGLAFSTLLVELFIFTLYVLSLKNMLSFKRIIKNISKLSFVSLIIFAIVMFLNNYSELLAFIVGIVLYLIFMKIVGLLKIPNV